MDVLLLTDQAEPASALPALGGVTTTLYIARLARWRSERRHHSADLAVVDTHADLATGRRVCREIAAAAPRLAVVAVVAPEDFVAVDLDWQLDDAVLATAGTAELHARLRMAAARRREAMHGVLNFGDLVLNPASYRARVGNRDLYLTLTEFKLLNYLVHNPGQACTRAQLIDEVWGHDCSRRTVDVHIQRLRAKLGADHEALVDTVRGVGYMAAGLPTQVSVA